jgi:hypothetical protein
MTSIEAGVNGMGTGQLFERTKQNFMRSRDAVRHRPVVSKAERTANSSTRNGSTVKAND